MDLFDVNITNFCFKLLLLTSIIIIIYYCYINNVFIGGREPGMRQSTGFLPCSGPGLGVDLNYISTNRHL